MLLHEVFASFVGSRVAVVRVPCARPGGDCFEEELAASNVFSMSNNSSEPELDLKSSLRDDP